MSAKLHVASKKNTFIVTFSRTAVRADVIVINTVIIAVVIVVIVIMCVYP